MNIIRVIIIEALFLLPSSASYARFTLKKFVSEILVNNPKILALNASILATKALQQLCALFVVNALVYPTWLSHLPTSSSLPSKNNLLTQSSILQAAQGGYLAVSKQQNIIDQKQHPNPTIDVELGQKSPQDEHKKLHGLVFSARLFISNTDRPAVKRAIHGLETADAKYANSIYSQIAA